MSLLFIFIVALDTVLLNVANSQVSGVVTCGVSNSRRGKIVSGSLSGRGQFPWQIVLRRNLIQVCGGAIISRNFVVTAAHCLRKKGVLDLSAGVVNSNETGQLRSVEHAFVHPDWRKGSWENDIALLKVNVPFNFDSYVAPLCVDSSWNDKNMFVVSGWGRTKEGGRQSIQLRHVTLQSMPNEFCFERYPYAFTDRTMFCAYSKGKDTCQGDSGGPAVEKRNGTYFLKGLVSWGVGCARMNTPGVYTNFSKFTEWVQSVIITSGDSVDVTQIMKTPLSPMKHTP